MPPFHKLTDEDLNALLTYLGAPSVGAPESRPLAASDKIEMTDTATKQSQFQFTGYRKFLDPDGYPAVAPPWGTLSAIDLNTGKYLWKIPFGEYPELAARGMSNTGTENYGGPVVTAGGLLFIGATIFDRQMHAYDSSTGTAGGGRDRRHDLGGVYVAFALP